MYSTHTAVTLNVRTYACFAWLALCFVYHNTDHNYDKQVLMSRYVNKSAFGNHYAQAITPD